jgi:non-homologous end joining protein Ku
MAAPSWKGAVTFAGFPIHVAMYQRIRSRSADSFKMLGSDDKPVRSILVESGEYEKLEKDPHAKVLTIGRNDTKRGVPIGKDEYVALTENQREAIAEGERSTVVEPDELVPVATVPFDLKDKSMFVVPDKKVPGSEASVDALYSYLSDTEQAYVTEVTLRSGSRDSILVLYPGKGGLLAVTLPFGEELNDEPGGYARTYNEQAAQVLGRAAEAYETHDFDFEVHESSYMERREQAIDAALNGVEPTQAKSKPPKTTGVDLMSALEEGIGAAPTAKKASRGKTSRGGKTKPRSKGKAKAKA